MPFPAPGYLPYPRIELASLAFPEANSLPLLKTAEDLIKTFAASLVAQWVKHLPTMWETWVRSLGREEPVEKARTTHSSTLAWKIPWPEKPGRLQSMGSQRVAKSRTRLSDFPFHIPHSL